MKRWREHGASVAVVVGLLLSVQGCAGATDAATDTGDVSQAPASTGAAGQAAAGVSGAAVSGTQAVNAGTGGGGGALAAQAGSSPASNNAAGNNAAVGGSGGTVAKPAGDPTFSAIYSEILTKGATGNCMFAACHGGEPDPAVNGGLQIKAGDKARAYKNLVDTASPGFVCSGKTYVVPGDSAGSLLYQKLMDAPPCGAKMPIGTPLTAPQIAQIAAWIDSGAQDN